MTTARVDRIIFNASSPRSELSWYSEKVCYLEPWQSYLEWNDDLTAIAALRGCVQAGHGWRHIQRLYTLLDQTT